MIRRWGSVFGTLRFRLIGWYVLLLVLTLVVFSVYIFFQFRDLQQTQQDTTLQATASSLRGLVDPGRPPNCPSFRRAFGNDPTIQDIYFKGIQVNLLCRDGTVVDSLGNSASEMPRANLPTEAAYATLSSQNRQWRVYTQAVGFPGNPSGWIQIGQPQVAFNAEFSRLFTPILVGVLLALIFATLGGLFLANRALSPIDRVTRTARSITTQDLSRRINYQGANDEIGRLAKTIDQMLDRLERGFEQERRFTSDASHELRTPLTALKGRLEVTLNRARTPEEYQQTLLDLSQEVDRLVRLSNSLLYLARLDQAGQNLQQYETLNLSDLLESVVESMEGVAELKQITLDGQIVPDLEVQGNLDQLTRLFINLLDNALKYTPAGGRVVVRVEKDDRDKKACVAVTDTGPGIAAEHLPHLFERFYRAEADRASSSGGAGLGLAIAYEIARQHDSILEVESYPGQGTTFRVQLPIQEAAKQKVVSLPQS